MFRGKESQRFSSVVRISSGGRWRWKEVGSLEYFLRQEQHDGMKKFI